MVDLIKVLIIESLNESFKKNGIEGTEQVIKEVYTLCPTLRDKMLEVYYELIDERKEKI